MPAFAMTAAATPGPKMRARLNPLEFSAIASRRSSRPTSSIIIDCRAGNLDRADRAIDRREREQPADRDVTRERQPPEHERFDATAATARS